MAIWAKANSTSPTLIVRTFVILLLIKDFIAILAEDSTRKREKLQSPERKLPAAKREIEVMPHLKEKYQFFKGEGLSPKKILYNNRSMESRIVNEKVLTKDELDIEMIPKKKKLGKSKEKYNILTNA